MRLACGDCVPREEGVLGATIGHKRRPVGSEPGSLVLNQAHHYTQHGSNIPGMDTGGNTRMYLQLCVSLDLLV